MTETDPVDPKAVATEVDVTEEEAHPRGTMLLMLLYLIVIVAMWGYVYAILLSRG